MNPFIVAVALILCGVMSGAWGDEDPALAYDKLGISYEGNPMEEWVRAGTDLRVARISEFMLGKMNTVSVRGRGTPAYSVMRRLLKDQPGITYGWLLDNYGRLLPAGRANMIRGLGSTQCQETYELYVHFLGDTAKVVNIHARATSAGPYYGDERVCDYAYNAMSVWFWRNPEGSEMKAGLFVDTPLAQRDEEIAKFKTWWSQHSGRILQTKPSLCKDYPELRSKLDAVKNSRPLASPPMP